MDHKKIYLIQYTYWSLGKQSSPSFVCNAYDKRSEAIFDAKRLKTLHGWETATVRKIYARYWEADL